MKSYKIWLTRSASMEKVETSATTFGQFFKELKSLGFADDKSKILHKETKVTLEHADIPMPSEGSTFIIVPKNSKAGVDAPIYEISDEDVENFKREVTKMVENAIAEFLEGKLVNLEELSLSKEVDAILKGFLG